MRVHDEVLDLFIELEADAAQLDAPVVYASAREGVATMDMDVTPVDLSPLFETIVDHVPRAADGCERSVPDAHLDDRSLTVSRPPRRSGASSAAR